MQDAVQQNGQVIWQPPSGQPYSRELWAPELHFIDKHWYIYFAADDGRNEDHRMYVLESKTTDALGEYVFRGKIAAPSDRWAIDGTVMAHKGQMYFIWSGWEGNTNVQQNLYIARMKNPTTVCGPRVLISKPRYGWETVGRPMVNEGPEVLKKNGRVFILYSASGSWTDSCCMGQLTLVGQNPLDPKGWKKTKIAVFAGTADVVSPGHASFTQSPDGTEDWIVYHAAKHPGAGWNRNLRMQRFTWDAEGNPLFGSPVSPGVEMAPPSEKRLAGDDARGKREANNGASSRVQRRSDPAKIEWDEKTLTLVEQGACYARMIRTKDGHVLCCYEKGSQVWVKSSVDNGASWTAAPVRVAQSSFGSVTNPELLELQDGSLLCCFNQRPNDGVHPFAILICTSNNGGHTWSAPRSAYEAGAQFGNGCWEPAAIQLAHGEIQLFFANESPYRESNEQEITMLRSLDDGRTWRAPVTISFRRGYRDGMPVPLLLRGGPRGIAVVIEDNGLCGNFKPVIVYSSLENNWRSGPVTGNNQHRWPALRVPLGPEVYAGAPYLRQMPSGETVLSFQCTERGRSQPHMVVCVGDNRCRDFTSWSVPFRVGAGTACRWNSLFVKSDDVVTAVSSTKIRGVQGVWTIDGRLKVRTRKLVAFAINEPEDVDVNEILFRPTAQSI